jgi:two-component system LytT family response regulator
MLKVLIMEDEHYTLRFLEKLVSSHPLVEEVLATSQGDEAIRLARQLPDVAFLDIELAPEDELNGIQAARNINIISPRTKFVFITGYSKYAIDSFVVHPYDYVLKPVQKEKLMSIISRLAQANEQSCEKEEKKLVLKSNEGLIFIDFNDIFFIEKISKKAFVHNRNGIFEASCSVQDLEKHLPNQFLRVHKSYIINLDKIGHIKDTGNQTYEVSFHGYKQIALISRNKFREHQDRFTPSL